MVIESSPRLIVTLSYPLLESHAWREKTSSPGPARGKSISGKVISNLSGPLACQTVAETMMGQ